MVKHLIRRLAQASVLPRKEWLRGGLGATIGIIIAGLIPELLVNSPNGMLMLIAPMGASAMLLFTVPASPLAQPWPVIGGNLVAGMIGAVVAQLISVPLLAAGVAVGASILAMAALRCLHPPGGAVALLVVLGGHHLPGGAFHFITMQVGLNALLLTLVGYVFNNATGHSYPHRAHMPSHPHPPRESVTLTDADYDAVLADYGEALDINSHDLEMLHKELIGRSEARAAARRD